MKTVGILAAMDTEADLIINKLEDRQTYHYGGYSYQEGTYGGIRLIVTICSIGKVSSAVSCQILIDKFDPDYIINTGIGGGLDGRLGLLSIVVGQDLVYHDLDHKIMEDHFPYTSVFQSDPSLVDLAMDLGKEAGLDIHKGRIVTGDLFVEDLATKTRLKEDFGGMCCEMEGAAISQVAYTNKLPSLVIRCISDMADDGGMMTYLEFKERASQESASLVLRLVERLS